MTDHLGATRHPDPDPDAAARLREILTGLGIDHHADQAVTVVDVWAVDGPDGRPAGITTSTSVEITNCRKDDR